MKRVIQYLFLSVFLFSSCIEENTDGCPATRNLNFTHYCLYDPDRSFDNRIGNEVVLYVYQEQKLAFIDRIPYDRISNGQTYSYKKQCEGEVDIVAWAVKAGSSTPIPQYNIGDDLYNSLSEMEVMAGTTFANPYYIDLYLGASHVENDIISEESTHTIQMTHPTFHIDVNVFDELDWLEGDLTNVYVQVEGTMNQQLFYHGVGQEAVVYVPVKNEHGNYITGTFGVFPSADAQTITFYIYKGNKCLASVVTQEKAVSGGKMIMDIYLGFKVDLVVNNWEVYPSVTWM